MAEERFFYKYIIISKAIGDFIAFESFLTNTEKLNLKEVIYLSPNETIPQFEFIDKSKFYNKNCKKIIINTTSKIKDKTEAMYSYFDINKEIEKDRVLIDWNFYNKEYENIIKEHNLKNYSFANQKLCKINKFKLPKKYVSICGWTYSRTKKRMFSIEDWEKTISILKKYDIKGVVLNNQNWYLENSWFKEMLKNEDCLIDLTEKTDIFEAIEIVKSSSCFMGIDSCLSIIATQSLPEETIIIKSNQGSSSRRLQNYYYSNLKTTNCLVKDIDSIAKYIL